MKKPTKSSTVWINIGGIIAGIGLIIHGQTGEGLSLLTPSIINLINRFRTTEPIGF